MVKRIGFLLFLVLPFRLLYGQELKADLQKIKDNYEAKEYTAEILYTFYNGAVKKEESSALHIFSKGSYYFKINDIEIIKTNKCQVIVSHPFKNITVLPSDEKNNYKEMSKIPVDTALKEVKQYSYKNISNTQGVYLIDLKKGEYSRIELYFNTKTYRIEKLKFYLNKQQYASDPDMANGIFVVEYKSYSSKITSEHRKLLSENKFIKISAGKTSLMPAYNKYELTDYLNVKAE